MLALRVTLKQLVTVLKMLASKQVRLTHHAPGLVAVKDKKEGGEAGTEVICQAR